MVGPEHLGVNDLHTGQFTALSCLCSHYFARHDYTGRVQMCRKHNGTPPGQPETRLSILTHGSGRCSHYKNMCSGRTLISVSIFPAIEFWPVVGIPPPGAAVHNRWIHPPGPISQFHPLGIIMLSRVTIFSKQRSKQQLFYPPSISRKQAHEITQYSIKDWRSTVHTHIIKNICACVWRNCVGMHKHATDT